MSLGTMNTITYIDFHLLFCIFTFGQKKEEEKINVLPFLPAILMTPFLSCPSLTQATAPVNTYEFPNQTLVLLDFNVRYHVIRGETMLEMRFKLWDYDVTH